MLLQDSSRGELQARALEYASFCPLRSWTFWTCESAGTAITRFERPPPASTRVSSPLAWPTIDGR